MKEKTDPMINKIRKVSNVSEYQRPALSNHNVSYEPVRKISNGFREESYLRIYNNQQNY